jgi:AcrR family transcriptional regulator
MPKQGQATREQILEAADQLFYAEGLLAVTMDRIAERAGVTKKTVYYHFRSKDDLLGSYLDSRHEAVMERYRNWAGTSGPVCERLRRMFRELTHACVDRNWRGCGFLRLACELADLPGHPACVAARRHKSDFEEWIRSMLEIEGRPDSARLAKALMALLDGAIVGVLIHRDPAYADAAASAAGDLLECSSAPPLTRAA